MALLAPCLLAGCGSDEPERAVDDPASSASSPAGSPSSSPSEDGPGGSSDAAVPEDAPACAQVWVEGATLARGYAGCVEDGEYVEADRLGCSSGQRLVTYDRSYGVLGGEVRQAEGPLEGDRAYVEAVRSCRG